MHTNIEPDMEDFQITLKTWNNSVSLKIALA